MDVVVQLTYWGIGLTVFAQQVCLPVPSMLLLMTAGALAAQGRGHLHLPLVLAGTAVGQRRHPRGVQLYVRPAAKP
jgi:membrane protein DedA with SNARE-associated domain